jgi:hypothetical protein
MNFLTKSISKSLLLLQRENRSNVLWVTQIWNANGAVDLKEMEK